jgi:hypothetical protein
MPYYPKPSAGTSATGDKIVSGNFVVAANSSSHLASFLSSSAEKAYIDKDGGGYFSGTTSISGVGSVMTFGVDVPELGGYGPFGLAVNGVTRYGFSGDTIGGNAGSRFYISQSYNDDSSTRIRLYAKSGSLWEAYASDIFGQQVYLNTYLTSSQQTTTECYSDGLGSDAAFFQASDPSAGVVKIIACTPTYDGNLSVFDVVNGGVGISLYDYSGATTSYIVASGTQLRIATPKQITISGSSTAISGNVGIGTSTPEGKLHVFGDAGGADTIGGSIVLNRYLNAGSWRGGAIFSYYPTAAAQDVLAFAVNNSTTPLATGSVKMVIAVDGKVGIGTVAPAYPLTVVGTISASGYVSATDFIATSDVRTKDNVQSVYSALSTVMNLRGVTFVRKGDDTSRKMGLIAQEVKPYVPEVVGEDKEGMMNISYGNLAGLFVEAIKDLKKENEELRSRISDLEKRMG